MHTSCMSLLTESGEDFELLSNSMVFESCQNRSCVSISIINNPDLVEEDKSFQVKFSLPRERRSEHSWIDKINLPEDTIDVTIKDIIEG